MRDIKPNVPESLTLDDIERYYRRVGQKSGMMRVAKLRENQVIVQALATEIGKELYKDLLEIMDGLLDQIIEQSPNDNRVIGNVPCPNCGSSIPTNMLRVGAQFSFGQWLLERWSSRINAFSRGVDDIKKKARGG